MPPRAANPPLFAWLLACCLPAVVAMAIETRQSVVTCPACGKDQQVVVATFTIRDQGLDGEPRWIDGKPGIWPSNVCVQCGCPLVDDAHGKQLATLLQGDTGLLARAREYLKSPEYLEAAPAPSCFLLARLFERLGADPRDAGELYLRSTWQAPDDAAGARRALRESLRCFERHLARPGPHDIGLRCLAGEIERRLGEFTAAEKRLAELQASSLDDDLRILVGYESHLVSCRDADRHLMSAAREWSARAR